MYLTVVVHYLDKGARAFLHHENRLYKVTEQWRDTCLGPSLVKREPRGGVARGGTGKEHLCGIGKTFTAELRSLDAILRGRDTTKVFQTGSARETNGILGSYSDFNCRA